jgi:Uma2 family endonuclease
VVTRAEATIDDLANAPDDGMYELIDGRLVRMPPTGFLPSLVAGEVFVSLRDYARRSGIGYALPDGIAYIVNLPRRRSLSPDASLTRSVPENKMRSIDGAPIFAAEVRSDGDYGPAADRAYAMKHAEYFAAGTEIVWDVDPVHQTILSYSIITPDAPTTFRYGDIADAEPALPGWRVQTSDIFGIFG